jgi:adenine-specific DNA-methyltransferase
MKSIINANQSITSNSPQLEILKHHFPNCFDKHGAFMPHKLQEMVEASGVALSRESYSLNWLGKSYARLLANENVRTLLKANLAHNHLPENVGSNNMLIKGDNLEVLKHLMGAYAGKVKMIYIDPPYNTGSDGFVYQDDRKFTVAQLSHLAGIDEDEAKRILEFTDSDSNSHSAWLTFMYPRLYLAKQLLRDDGVIFISIDDNEQAQLKLLMDEVFGEENFITTISRVMKTGGAKGRFFSPNIEFILVYVRNIEQAVEFKTKIGEDQIANYYNKLQEGGERGGERYGEERLYLPSLDIRPNQRYWLRCPDGSYVIPPGVTLPNELAEGAKVLPVSGDGVWRWTYDTYKEAFNSDRIIFKRTGTSGLVDENGKQSKYNIYFKLWLSDQQKKGKVPANFIDKWENRHSSAELAKLEIPFDYAKPSALISYLVDVARVGVSDLVIDFFAGSGTTAHAVMQLNAEDGGNRQFICVQIDEPTDPKSEAYKAGYKTIYDITAERIKRAAAKIKAENPLFHGDLGFKQFETIPVFEGYLDEPDELTPELELFNANQLSVAERHSLMLTWQAHDGIALNTTLTPLDLAGYPAYQGGRLVYFIEPDLSLDAIVALLERLDNLDDKAFVPSQLVVFGYLLNSKIQREMTEAVKLYKGGKGELTLDVRF